MPQRHFTPERRLELIAQFNERVHTPSAYLEIPNLKDISCLAQDKSGVRIHEENVGHGVLILSLLEDFQYEAIPFALDPAVAEHAVKEELNKGYHKYVSWEALKEMNGSHTFLACPLYLWRTKDSQVVTLIRGRGLDYSTAQIEATRQLSEETPNVIYVATRLSDEAHVKILGGTVMARATGKNKPWVTQPSS